MSKFTRKTTIDSFECAFQGLIHTWRTQKHMRWHMATGALVLALALWLKLTKVEVLIVLGTITLVLVVETLNTAVEVTIDLVTGEYHPLAAAAKNIAAGAVLLSAINALIVGYVIFVPNLEPFLPSVLEQIRRSPPYLTLAALVLVMSLVVALKILNKESLIMQGGMPSGHTAVAFALATAVVFLARRNPTITILAGLMALLVAESRLETRIHNTLEVLAGAVIGILLTVLLFQFLNRFAWM